MLNSLQCKQVIGSAHKNPCTPDIKGKNVTPSTMFEIEFFFLLDRLLNIDFLIIFTFLPTFLFSHSTVFSLYFCFQCPFRKVYIRTVTTNTFSPHRLCRGWGVVNRGCSCQSRNLLLHSLSFKTFSWSLLTLLSSLLFPRFYRFYLIFLSSTNPICIQMQP